MTLASVESNLVSNAFNKGMQNPALVLHDEEGCNVTELEELSCVNEHNSCGPTAINIENSKDVIVGPVTQFHGPVTIYQGFNGVPSENKATTGNNRITQNGKLVKSESTSSDTFPGAEKPSENSLLRSRRLIYIGVAVVIALIFVVSLCATMLPINKDDQRGTASTKDDKVNYSSDQEEMISTKSDKANYSQGNNGTQLQRVTNGSLISRNKWGAQTTNCTNPLRHPTPLVIICHTGSSLCKSFSQCSAKVFNIQADHLNRGFEDIWYNFLIGGDGIAYVGRGWDTKNKISANSISIAFIGNFVNDYLTESMNTTAKKLIENGVKSGKLSQDYKVICHNQTVRTLSPGRHVYEEVKKWHHFDPSNYL